MTMPNRAAEFSVSTSTTLASRESYGYFCCILASIFYSVVYALLRLLTGYHVSPEWSIFMLNFIMTLVAMPFFLSLCFAGKIRFPGFACIALFLGGSLSSNFLGVRPILWAYEEIGLAVASPLLQSFQIIIATVLGMLLFRERLTLLKVGTICILIAAVTFLSMSKVSPARDAEAAADSVASLSEVSPAARAGVPGHAGDVSPEHSPGPAVVRNWGKGIFFTFVSGFGMALYVVLLHGALRLAAKHDADGKSDGNASVSPALPQPMVLVLMGLCTVCTFGVFILVTGGHQAFYHNIDPSGWWIILATGTATAVGFFFKADALRYITASKLSLVCVLQVLLLTLMGLTLFGEKANYYIWPGMILTVAGVAAASKTR